MMAVLVSGLAPEVWISKRDRRVRTSDLAPFSLLSLFGILALVAFGDRRAGGAGSRFGSPGHNFEVPDLESWNDLKK